MESPVGFETTNIWYDNEGSEILKNNWRMKGILDEPPCRASMRNSGNKRMIKRKERWKHKVKPCNDLDGSSRRYNSESLELREKKIWNNWNREFTHRDKLRKMNPTFGRSKNKNYVMRILHQFKLMTSKGFGILLILVERIKIDIAPTWENLQRTTGRMKQQMNWYDKEGREILNEPP